MRQAGASQIRTSGSGKTIRQTGRNNTGRRVDPRMQKMQKRGKFHAKTVIARNNKQLRQHVLQTMNRKQKRAWKKLSPQEREKLLQSVEKKVSRKLDRQYKKTPGNTAKEIQKTKAQAQAYRKKNAGSATGQTRGKPSQNKSKNFDVRTTNGRMGAPVRRDVQIQAVKKKRVIRKVLKNTVPENLPQDRNALRVSTVQVPPSVKGISQNDLRKIQASMAVARNQANPARQNRYPDTRVNSGSRVNPGVSNRNSVQIGAKQQNMPRFVSDPAAADRMRRDAQHRIVEQEMARSTAFRKANGASEAGRTVPVNTPEIQSTDAFHSRTARIEKAYNKQFGKELKKVSRKQTKLYRREFTHQLNNEIQKIKGKEDSQKEAQREKTYDEMAAKGFAGSVRAAALPISLPLKIKTEKIMMQIAAAIGGFIASVVSAVLPIIAIIAAIVSIFSFIAGFFGILAGSWDPASDGLPDAPYVTNTAVQWAEYIAQNDDHGYNDGYFSRWGPTDYSNITFVVTAFDRAGLSLKKDGAKEVGDLYDACMLNGFMDVKDEVSSVRDLKTGDLLVKLGSDARLEIYCGDNKMVGAVCDERGRQKHGESGDQTGQEICIENYANKGWDHVLRYYGDMTLFGGIGSELAEFALSFEGRLPYVYGGSSLVTGADCSGFVQAVFAHFGYSIPRTAGAQYSAGRKVGNNVNDWQPGDIIYYSRTGTVQDGGTGEHIVIYVGNGKVVGESNPSTGCVVYNWDYRSDYVGTARYLPDFDNGAALIGNDNSTKIWNYLRRTLGCSRAAAAGVMGSIYAESEFDPTAIQPNGVGHGICQWSWSRWYGADGLQNFANAHHKNWSDLGLQLAFFKHEAVENNSMAAYYPGGWQKYKAITSVDGEGGAAHVFFYSFEYGGYVSYSTFTSDEFERNFACTTKRLRIARSCYQNAATYP